MQSKFILKSFSGQVFGVFRAISDARISIGKCVVHAAMEDSAVLSFDWSILETEIRFLDDELPR